jgi:hypothetical protein
MTDETLAAVDKELGSIEDRLGSIRMEVIALRLERSGVIIDDRQLTLARHMRRNLATDNLP